MTTMFKIQKLTKYTFFALTLAFVIFIAIPNSAKAGDDYGYYMGMGSEDFGYYYSEPSYSFPETSYVSPSYYPEPTYYSNESTGGYYPEPTYYSNNQSTGYYPEPTYYEPTTYYNEPSYTYSQPSYSFSDYSYGSGCTSCSYGGYTYTPPPQIVYVPTPQPVVPPVVRPALDAYCVISPNNLYINDTVTISGSASGGTGSYTYNWSGSDGISGYSQTITGRFTSIGSKTVSLTVTSGAQSVTRTCNAYVNQNNNYNYGYNYNYNYTNLTATCSALPSNANIGDNIVWTVYPNGGNGSYTYSWTGTDGLSYGNAYQIQQRYTTPGTKIATVIVYSSNGQSVTATCNANIVGSVINPGTPISGIYLSEVPATGISFNLKVALYILGLILWSAFVGFMLVQKKKSKLAFANRSRIEDFKEQNLKKKGLM